MNRVKQLLLAFAFYFVFTGVCFCWRDGWRSGLIEAFIGAVIFALMLPLLQKLTTKWMSNALKMPVGDEEQAIFCGGANHFKGIEGVGGKLVLFHNALVFKSHKLNIQKHELTIPLADIAEVSPYSVLGLFPTGLKITLQNGQTEKFVVGKREEWIEGILTTKAVNI